MKMKRPHQIDPTKKHVRLYRWLLGSEAWAALKPGPRAALIELYSLYNGVNNGELFLSAREAARRLAVGKDTADVYLWELEAKGFIRPLTPGSFDWKGRQATVWVLTELPLGNELPEKTFMRWKRGDCFTARPAPGSWRKQKQQSGKSGRAVLNIRTRNASSSLRGNEASEKIGPSSNILVQ